MYESPIEMVFSDLVSDSVKKMDEYIVACVQQVGVKVDKDELVKALEFDRGQYEKGWHDRDAEIVRHGHWIEVQRIHEKDHTAICECSLCGDTVWVYDGQRAWNYCPNCGAKMDEVETK